MNVGILNSLTAPNLFQLKSLENLKNIPSEIDQNFLLILDDGEILCSRINRNFELAKHPFLLNSSKSTALESNAILKIIGDFLNSRGIEPSKFHQEIYKDETFDSHLQAVLPDFAIINTELMGFLSQHPEYLHELHWRKFEELLDKLFRELGYETILGPGRGDMGVDLRLIRRDPIASILTLVQAKKYAPHNRITLQPVQALYGALDDEDANTGLLVSTSEFEPVARKFAKNILIASNWQGRKNYKIGYGNLSTNSSTWG